MRDENKRKRLKAAAMRNRKRPEENSEEELRRKKRKGKIEKLICTFIFFRASVLCLNVDMCTSLFQQTVRSPGVKLVRSPLAMFAKVATLRKEMSPQAKLRVMALSPTHPPSKP
jgi:hypothetical protein